MTVRHFLRTDASWYSPSTGISREMATTHDENSGPVAILDLKTLKPRVLKATNNIDGEGPCSESEPQWSPDGKWISVATARPERFYTACGNRLARSEDRFQRGVLKRVCAWVGGGCVLYEQTPENDRNAERYFLLNLATGESDSARRVAFVFQKRTSSD